MLALQPRTMKAPPTVPLFGVPLAVIDLEGVGCLVQRALDERAGPLTIDATNTMGMAEACVDDRLRHAMQTYDLLLPDGMPLVWIMNAKGARLRASTPGINVIRQILRQLPKPTRIAMVGGHEALHRAVVANSSELYPNARFVSLDDVPYGPIDDAFIDLTMGRIADADAQLVFVCLGVPRQYYWTALAKPHLGNRIAISVGGAFAYLAGEAKVAPRWMQRHGLWWVHRLAQDPRRLAPRYFKYNPMFLANVLRREVMTGRLWTERLAEDG